MKKNRIILEKKNSSANLSKTLIMGLIGLVLLLIPSSLTKIVGLLVGITLLLMGMVQVINYIKNKNTISNFDLIVGILYSILGAIIIFKPHSVMNLITIVVGIYLIINALIKVKIAITLKNVTDKWIGTLLVSLITAILGFLLIFNPFASVIAITQLMGMFLVIVTIFDLLDTYIFRK